MLEDRDGAWKGKGLRQLLESLFSLQLYSLQATPSVGERARLPFCRPLAPSREELLLEEGCLWGWEHPLAIPLSPFVISCGCDSGILVGVKAN